MKKIILSVLILLTINYASNKPFSTCNVENIKDEWLNKNYDHKMRNSNQDVETDFFLLVYSNSPKFCKFMKKRRKLKEVPLQCSSSIKFGWVIHGLWAESESAYINNKNREHPRFCQGDLDALELEIMKPYLCMSPGTKLLQGEWEKHGACDFNHAQNYFKKTLELSQQFKVPPSSFNTKKATKWMKRNNSQLKNKRLYRTRHEFGICFNKNFNLISCPKKNR